ncbi:sulfurtransferase [Thiomicrorhabdus immobilis]|uniref:Sulfurtransferase n=1 Tax=Thiomicrorhabdus immobilis TaxID=2791037 RepID=A0ABM7MAH7_9GAMM|nr:sulfurtransferase [Thiomicrorhabdus immobilis]BCN92340.1 sulfurtransferase [Thiomicrorhabdus immobilis]
MKSWSFSKTNRDRRPFRVELNLLLIPAFIILLMLSAVSPPAFADNTLRISAKQLKETLNQPGLVVLDVRSKEEYAKEHIPGAFNFPETQSYHDKSLDGRIVQPQAMQTYLQAIGITVDTSLVIYDQGNLTDAARVFWTLEVYGLHDVKVLDMGLNHWKKLNLATTSILPEAKSSHYIPVINHERLATKLSTLIATKNPNQQVIDTRSQEAYEGKVSTAKRFGHIITAINIPAQENLTQQQGMTRFKSKQELESLYGGLSKDHKIILYCSLGHISATNYLTLRELGFNVANYDASWNEWGNDFSLPIE